MSSEAAIEDTAPVEGRGATELVVGVALLAAAAVSVALAIVQVAGGNLADLVDGNVLAPRRRLWMLWIPVGCGLATAAAVALTSLRLRPAVILRWGRVASPLLVAALVPSLFMRGPWAHQELPYLVLLGATGLLLERLLALSLDELQPRAPVAVRRLRWLPPVLVGAAILYYALLISHYTLISHLRLTTLTADLGEYDNQFFNSLHGHPFRLPASEGDLRDWSALKFHADFIIYFLLPIYALRPGPEILLIIQTVLVALTALPTYLFAARRLPSWIAAIVAVAYLLMPAVQRPNFYDFHAVPVGMFFVAWAIWALDRILAGQARRRDHLLFWSAFALALLSREDIAFGMTVVSLVVLVSGRAPRLALTMLAIAGGYFLAIKFLIMPRVGLSWYDSVYDGIKAAGFKGYSAVVVTMLTNPVFVLRSMVSEAKLLFLLHMTVPLLFLWLRRPALLVAAVPSVFFTLMVTNRPAMYQSSFQYSYQWFPYIVIATVLGLQHLARRGPIRQSAAALALALVAAGAGFQYGVLLGGRTIVGGFSEKDLVVSAADRARYQDLRALAAQIPPDASVAATEAEGPHVSTRLVLYNLRYGLGDRPDFLLFNRTAGDPPARRAREALAARDYGVVDQRGDFVLARRGHDPAANAAVVDQLRR
jgi:uncharacterized membrane protein